MKYAYKHEINEALTDMKKVIIQYEEETEDLDAYEMLGMAMDEVVRAYHLIKDLKQSIKTGTKIIVSQAHIMADNDKQIAEQASRIKDLQPRTVSSQWGDH